MSKAVSNIESGAKDLERQLREMNAELIKSLIREQELTEIARKTDHLLKLEIAYAKAIVETVREPIIVMDKDMRVISASRAFYETFSVNADATEGEYIYDLGNRQWDIPLLRKALEEVLPKKSSFESFEVEHEFETVGRKTMLLNACEVRQDGEGRLVLLAIEDVTLERLNEQELARHVQDLERFNRAAVGREDRMIELKKEINALAVSLGEKERYKTALIVNSE